MKPFSIKARLKSFKFAFKGFQYFIATQHNAWIHFIAFIVVVIAGFYFKLSEIEWCAILIVSGLVIVAEIVNTAIEKLADFVSPENNKDIGIVKDLGAAAVLFAAIIAVIVGILIFGSKILF